MNRQEASKIVSVIIAACPAQSSRIDSGRAAAMIDTFSTLLGDLDYPHVAAAVRVLLQTRTWMPSVAEIRATVLELARGPVTPGGEAWGSVTRAIRSQGKNSRPGVDFTFSDPVTAQCVTAMNWGELCLSDNQVADRARFIDLYDRLAAQDRREETSPLLSAARDARSGRSIPAGQLISKVLGDGHA